MFGMVNTLIVVPGEGPRRRDRERAAGLTPAPRRGRVAAGPPRTGSAAVTSGIGCECIVPGSAGTARAIAT